jgi:2-polyprenyl-3-methyl-5-hydroxy-6-metoxy-1,4-benzoquinol methylase
MSCNVCIDGRPAIVYESSRSLTSLCEIRQDPTTVRVCPNCAHIQTDEIANAAEYYDQNYGILTDSEEEDQIYEIRDGITIYRTEHQLNVLLDKLLISDGAKILDFGCAKSSMMRRLSGTRPDVQPHLYDVSDRYMPFWEKFVPQERCATYEIPDNWNAAFDIVTSFFSLEHIATPQSIVETISRLLRPGGVFYGIVPNVLDNSADFIVIDHTNHFTWSSLDALLRSAGLVPTSIDDSVHRGAWVFSATLPADGKGQSWLRDPGMVETDLQHVAQISDFWSKAANRLAAHETDLPGNASIAIYGAGFYGAFIYSSLRHPEKVKCFIDQNPYLQGREIHGTPVVSPVDIPQDTSHIFVGLNPDYAASIIADIDALQDQDISFFYL